MKGNVKRELIGNEGMVILDTARRLIRRNAVDNLMKLVNKTHPADIAWVFRHFTPEERNFVFNIIAQTDMVGDFLSELDQAIMLEVVENLTPLFMVNIIKEMAPDDAADILEAMPAEFADEIRRLMGREEREEVDELLKYLPDTAGGLMSPDFMALDEELSVGDAILKVQERSEEMETSLEELADRSVNLGCRLIAAAHDYFTGTISREMCEETIVGESLHTGRLGKTMQDISHSASISNI
jgi:magnesium transporter